MLWNYSGGGGLRMISVLLCYWLDLGFRIFRIFFLSLFCEKLCVFFFFFGINDGDVMEVIVED